MIAENKKRYYLSLNVDTAEKAQKTARDLGLTLSQYVNMTLNALNQGSSDNAFETFVTTLAETTQKGSQRTPQNGKKPKNLPKMIYTGEG